MLYNSSNKTMYGDISKFSILKVFSISMRSRKVSQPI